MAKYHLHNFALHYTKFLFLILIFAEFYFSIDFMDHDSIIMLPIYFSSRLLNYAFILTAMNQVEVSFTKNALEDEQIYTWNKCAR